MRFLYGDSTPFPYDYDVLATLESFMTAATRIVQLQLAARDAVRAVEDAAKLTELGAAEIDRFHECVAMAIQSAQNEMRHPEVIEFARQLSDFAAAYVGDRRARYEANKVGELARVKAESEGGALEQRAALSKFLKTARLPVLGRSMSVSVVQNGKDVHHEASAEFDHPNGVHAAFALKADNLADWRELRVVGDFAPETELLVGVDKSWLRGTVTAKQVAVDDWIVTEFAYSDDVFEVSLRRKMTEPEILAFRLERGEVHTSGTLQSNMEGSTLSGTLTLHDVAALERLWKAIEHATRELSGQRGELLQVTLDGQAVFEHSLILPLVARLVTSFAPIVHEIALRSPSPAELSLKTESEQGRREEIYLRKEDLLRKLQPLTAEGRRVFAPLGLDSWVPSVTSDPPKVSTRTPYVETPVLAPSERVAHIPSVPPDAVELESE